MVELKDILRLLKPAWRGLPFILACLVGAFWLANRSLRYSTQIYQSVANLRLDDKGGFTNNNLYKDFDVFSSAKNLETETQTLKSSLLLQKAVEKLDFRTSYFRVGKIRTSEMYNASPFRV